MFPLLDLDPNIVKPGWTPLLITVALAAVMVLLFLSLRKQFRRIDVSRSQPGVTDPEAARTPDREGAQGRDPQS